MKRAIALVVLFAMLAPGPVFAQDQVDADSPSARYRIAASDVLTVKYRYTPEYDYTGAVPPDGVVSLPIVGELMVSGMTVTDAQNAIRDKASQRLRDPEITVEVKEFEKPRFFVGGEVGAPGQFELRGRISVLEAIAMAKGFKSSAKHSQVVLFRRVDADHAFTKLLDAKKLAKSSGEVETLMLQPGDFIYVPQNRFSKMIAAIPLAGLGVLLGTTLR